MIVARGPFFSYRSMHPPYRRNLSMLPTVPQTRRCYGAVMVWLGLVLFTSIAVAMLRGGRLLHLAEIHLRMWSLLLLGFALQFARLFLPADAGLGISGGGVAPSGVLRASHRGGHREPRTEPACG